MRGRAITLPGMIFIHLYIKAMKRLLLLPLLWLGCVAGCDTPNHSATNRISTAPMSADPTETMPPASNNSSTTGNRVESTTGTAPKNELLPPHLTDPAGNDSTARR